MKKCQVCGTPYKKRRTESKFKWARRKYCSMPCASTFRKGKPLAIDIWKERVKKEKECDHIRVRFDEDPNVFVCAKKCGKVFLNIDERSHKAGMKDRPGALRVSAAEFKIR
ncbi:MAG: hypothetical protein E6Q97_16310 [Desulfurellales bacterium]|nr:MAG: hypothetical protein E6Q97_16310 [Desulfurellales bacterium]